MLSLNNYSKYIDNLGCGGIITISVTNIGDIFRQLKALGIEEVEVNKEQMGFITDVVVANLPSENTDDLNKEVKMLIKTIKEGEIDKFMGIKLHLE